MSALIEAYKKTLKPKETEEFSNIWLFRPLSFLLVYAVRKTWVSPNFLTLLSLISGICSGILLASGYLLPAFIAIVLTLMFDCADGQLARLTGKSSKIGKLLDVSADAVSYFSFFIGVSYYMYSINSDASYFWYIAFCFGSIVLNIIFYDQFKNQYIRYVYKNYKEGLETIDDLKHQYKSEKKCLKKIFMFAYFIFYYCETKILFFGSLFAWKKQKDVFSLKHKPSDEESAKFKKHFYLTTRLWTILGTATHYFIMLIILAVGRMDLLLPVFVWFSLIALGTLLVMQNIVFLFYKPVKK